MTDWQPLCINVETDDRTVLFPAGKYLTHLSVQLSQSELVKLEAIFLFNEARESTSIIELGVDDCFAFGRSILDSVYQGRSQHVITETLKIGIIFNPNGFVISFGTGAGAKDLFIASPAILRLAQAMMRIADRMDAIPAN